jgi:predicted amidohydrolase
MTSGIDPLANAGMLVAAMEQAAREGAAMLFTPEMTGLIDRNRARAAAHIVGEDEDRVLAAAREAAARLGLWVHLGSLAIRPETKTGPDGRADDTRLANRAFVIDDTGAIAARYDKIHMFDVDLASGETWRDRQPIGPARRSSRSNARSAGWGWRSATTSAFPPCSRRWAARAATASRRLPPLPCPRARRTGT